MGRSTDRGEVQDPQQFRLHGSRSVVEAIVGDAVRSAEGRETRSQDWTAPWSGRCCCPPQSLCRPGGCELPTHKAMLHLRCGAWQSDDPPNAPSDLNL
ncbi:hypothetical protein NDU88_008387 [Pleurodeles waltl]|uniref:Uncharacterized protein n=1 Tax=Pleurodeles waltl TaxID=8319 RepID=A0AAV7PRG9_PLEWA|nr:hypothetical protein NDU88_008387 [Pleurodeles waltl]